MSTTNKLDQLVPSPIPTPPNFPVTWEHPDDGRLFWTFDRMHCPEPLTPMSDVFIRYTYQDAVNTAAQELELPIRIRNCRINTYFYWSIVPVNGLPEEMEAQDRRSQEKLHALMGRPGEIWTTEWLPEVKQHLASLEEFDLSGATLPALLAHLEEAIARIKHLWEIHFLIAFPFLLAMSLFDELYHDLFGNESALDAYRLLQGFDNKTLEADRALWQLSRKALTFPQVRQVLEEYTSSDVVALLEPSSEGRAFLVELRAYLSAYGQGRDKVFELSEPSRIEDPIPVIKNLKDYITQPDRDLLAEMAALAAERERLVAEARGRLKGYPRPVVGQFEFFLKAAQEATVVSEDHNFWIDSCSYYQLRRILLEFGRRFAEASVLDKPGDVFYLTPDELKETVAALPWIDRHQLAAARRAEMEFFRTIQPPPAIGMEPAEPPPDNPLGRAIGKFFGGPLQPPTEPNTLRGHAGSPGITRGPARVIRSLAEAGKLQKGDVLVAEATLPPWTPLFATAAAIVTDSGGILSHCAVVAREYRIPAVVGTGVATHMIHDGQMLEVDGNAGLVRMVEPA